MIFFAGLEGSGHHATHEALVDYCVPSSQSENATCRASDAIMRLAGESCVAEWEFDIIKTTGKNICLINSHELLSHAAY